MSRETTFVLVPGNFLPPTYYASTAKLLESHGYPTRVITIPSTGSKTILTSNEPDVAAVREAIEEVSDAGKEIVIVAHSYGAIPTCEAVKGLGHQERLKLGMSGGVVRLVFIAAWLLQEGESAPVISAQNKMEAPWAKFEVSWIPTWSISWCTTNHFGLRRAAMSVLRIQCTPFTTTPLQM